MQHYVRTAIISRTIAFVLFGLVFIGNGFASTAQRIPGMSPAAIQALTPDGYKLAKHIPWESTDGQFFRIAGFDDSNKADPAKPVMFLLLGWEGRWVVHDTVLPHYDSTAGGEYNAPNYFTDISRVQVDSRFLILIRTTLFGGGSGSLQYFDLYDVEDQKLVLVKSFNHGRFERYYFALYNGVIYDADLVCKRGTRRHKSFVYTCYLDVKKYHFDGREMSQIASEPLWEKQGPWFLCDSYRFLNIEHALKKGQIFHNTE